jgi:hypothetical protein
LALFGLEEHTTGTIKKVGTMDAPSSAEPSRAGEATNKGAISDHGDSIGIDCDDYNDEEEGESVKGILIHDDGTITSTSIFLSLALALYLGGRTWYAAVALLVAAMMGWGAIAARKVPWQDKLEIRFNVMEAHDVVREMVDWEGRMVRLDETSNSAANTSNKQQDNQQNDDVDLLAHRRQRVLERGMLTIRVGLSTMAKKYGHAQQRRKQRRTSQNQHERVNRSNSNKQSKAHRDADGDDDDGMELLCQEAAYVGFRTVLRFKCGASSKPSTGQSPSPPTNSASDMVTIASLSLSLLALVAKHPDIQERCAFQADTYGLDLPIGCLNLALDCAKVLPSGESTHTESSRGAAAVNPVHEDDKDGWELEQRHAELQRKGCLLLGALCGGGGGAGGGGAGAAQASCPRDMATLVAQEGGVQAMLNALDYFRYHSDVANWALWALFTLCYESPAHRRAILELHGIPVVLRAMRNCPDSVEVARHGTALLFDLMRQEEDDGGGIPAVGRSDLVDVWKVRKKAVDAGLHPVLVQALKSYVDEADIAMMSREMLVGTNYQGDDLSSFLVPGR